MGDPVPCLLTWLATTNNKRFHTTVTAERLWPCGHLVRVMRKRDLTKKRPQDKKLPKTLVSLETFGQSDEEI